MRLSSSTAGRLASESVCPSKSTSSNVRHSSVGWCRTIFVMGARLAGVGQAYARVIATPSYFPLWLGQLLSSFGDTLHYIALVVLVFQLTGQGLLVAGLVAAEVVPVMVLGPGAGVS